VRIPLYQPHQPRVLWLYKRRRSPAPIGSALFYPNLSCCIVPALMAVGGCAVTKRRVPVGAKPTRRFAASRKQPSRRGGDEMSEAFG